MINFFESLLACISGMVKQILLKFGMWPSLSRRHLHCKFGAISTCTELHMREKLQHCSFCHSVVHTLFSWAAPCVIAWAFLSPSPGFGFHSILHAYTN